MVGAGWEIYAGSPFGRLRSNEAFYGRRTTYAWSIHVPGEFNHSICAYAIFSRGGHTRSWCSSKTVAEASVPLTARAVDVGDANVTKRDVEAHC